MPHTTHNPEQIHPYGVLPLPADLLEKQSGSDVASVQEREVVCNPAVPPAFLPKAPTTGKETGLPDAFIQSLLFKSLLAAGNITSRDLARATALPGRAVVDMLTMLKATQLVQHTDSAGQGDFVYALTDAGRLRAGLYMEDCAYSGPAPVTLESYIQSVNAQGLASVHPKREDLERAFGDLLIDEKMFRRLGPAINSGRGLFLYGFPGNGKTSIAERITDCFGDSVWIPHSIFCSGEIITLFDPESHKLVDAAPLGPHGPSVDPRWVKIRRPTIIVGGELTMEALDLCRDPHTKVTEASLQLKSNTGTLVIDDFGRQRMTPIELLNRWIVPLEKRYDFLTLATGRKVKVPFDQLIIFSTNLEPKALVDEAFLRRIPYKIKIVDPTEEEFRKLFEIMAPLLGVEIAPGGIDYLIETHYRTAARPFRCCQPRDLLMQVRNAAAYAGDAPLATPATFDAACENYFAVMQPSPGVTANEHGIAVPLLAITMLAVIGMATLGIDVGMLATSASEVQNAADITALAGVQALAKGDTPPEDNIAGFLPSPCGGGNQAPMLTADGTDYLDVIEGGTTKVFGAVECMSQNNPAAKHTIAIVACAASTHFNEPAAVVGFASIEIKSVTTSGPAEGKGIAIKSIQSLTAGEAGGGQFGVRVARLVR